MVAFALAGPGLENESLDRPRGRVYDLLDDLAVDVEGGFPSRFGRVELDLTLDLVPITSILTISS